MRRGGASAPTSGLSAAFMAFVPGLIRGVRCTVKDAETGRSKHPLQARATGPPGKDERLKRRVSVGFSVDVVRSSTTWVHGDRQVDVC